MNYNEEIKEQLKHKIARSLSKATLKNRDQIDYTEILEYWKTETLTVWNTMSN